MAHSKHTGRTCGLRLEALTQTGLVTAFLAAAGVVSLAQSSPADGLVQCWGSNDWGKCNPPKDLGTCLSVAAGSYHSIAVRIDGTVRCWGAGTTNSGSFPQWGQSIVPVDLGMCSSVSGGYGHTIALRIDGTVRCWGAGTTNTGSNYEYGQSIVPEDLGPCTSIAAGLMHSIAVRSDGSVRCWGDNYFGQCDTPPDLGSCLSIAGGGAHTTALRNDGMVRCWGYNEYGQCFVPPDLGTCLGVAGAYYHTIALRSDRTVRCWGSNKDGQCNVPKDLGTCSSVAAGYNHTIALRSDGTVRAWGNNGYGQSNMPTGSYISVIAGAYNSIAIANPDCDGNGIADATEIAGHDCNNDSILDACNARYDTLEDCNNNGLGDSCEKELTLALHSSQLAPIGFNTNQTWTVQAATRAQSPVTLRIHGHGDFSGLQEYVRVKVGPGFDEHALQNTTDCENPGTPSISTFTITPEQFNAAIGADGALRVVMQPSIAVDPAGCNGGTWIEASLDYIGALPADCNANGLLDSCEIAAGYSPDSNQNGVVDTCESLLLDCPTDFNQSGSTDGADLGILLAAWGATGQPGVDLNHDGIINGADLGALLANWGACAN